MSQEQDRNIEIHPVIALRLRRCGAWRRLRSRAHGHNRFHGGSGARRGNRSCGHRDHRRGSRDRRRRRRAGHYRRRRDRCGREGRRRPGRRIDAESACPAAADRPRCTHARPRASRVPRERATLDPGRQSRAALAAKLPLLGDAAMAAGNKLPFAQPAALRAAAPNNRFPAPGTCQLSRLFLRKPVAHSFTSSSRRPRMPLTQSGRVRRTRKPTLQSR